MLLAESLRPQLTRRLGLIVARTPIGSVCLGGTSENVNSGFRLSYPANPVGFRVASSVLGLEGFLVESAGLAFAERSSAMAFDCYFHKSLLSFPAV